MFTPGKWSETIDCRDFIVRNYTPYDGDASFLAPPSDRTKDLWDEVLAFKAKEHAAGGVLDIDEHTISTITSHAPGYLIGIKSGLSVFRPMRRSSGRSSRSAEFALSVVR